MYLGGMPEAAECEVRQGVNIWPIVLNPARMAATLARRVRYKLDFSAVDSDRMTLAAIHAASGVEETRRSLFDEIVIP